MARINLLPWRDKQRDKRQKDYLTMLGLFALVAASLVFASHLFISKQISTQNKRNSYLESEIVEVEKRITEIKDLEKTKQALLDRTDVIQQLQVSRPSIVHLFDELVATLPGGIFVKDIRQTGQSLQIEGSADSNARVSSYMRNLNDSEWLDNTRLEVIQRANDSESIQNFSLITVQTNPNSDEDEQVN